MFGIASASLNPLDFKSMQHSFKAIYPEKEQHAVETSHFSVGTSFELGRSLSRNKEENVSVWVDGEAYNLSELKTIFPFVEGSSFSLSLIRAYQSNVLEDFLSKIDGYFFAILIDGNTEQVNLISDRYGMRMLYWYTDSSRLIFSANILDILSVGGVNSDIDRESIECFKELGYVLEDNTLFENIKLLKPASIMKFDIKGNSVSFIRYWMWSQIEKKKIEFDDAIDKLGELFLAAVNRRYTPEENVGVAVSGGLDSRAIVAALSTCYPNQEYIGYTFGIEGCDDIKLANQVLTKAGWQHNTYYFTQDNWLESRLPYIDVTSGLLDMQHMHGCEFLHELSKYIDININGYAGDAILGGGFLGKVPWDTRASHANIEVFFGKFSYMVNVDDEFYDFACVEPVIYMNRVRRFTAMGSVCGLNCLEQRKPFFDNQLVEFVFSLPDSYRANNRIYSEMLKRFFPEYFLDIPWQKTGKIVGILKPKSIYLKVYHRLRKLFFGERRGHKKTRDFTDYPSWLRSEKSIEFFYQLFSQDSEIVKRNIQLEFIDRFFEPHLNSVRIDNSNIILRMATLEIFLRKVRQSSKYHN